MRNLFLNIALFPVCFLHKRTVFSFSPKSSSINNIKWLKSIRGRTVKSKCIYKICTLVSLQSPRRLTWVEISAICESSACQKIILPNNSVRTILPDNSVRTILHDNSVRTTLPDNSVRTTLPDNFSQNHST